MTRIITVGILLIITVFVGQYLMNGSVEVMEALTSSRNSQLMNIR